MTSFGVPFKINNSDGSFLEVQLYVSKDHGQSWAFHESRKPDQTEFPFESEGDGEYWFALKTLDRNKQLWPPGHLSRPELRILVDTRQPTLDFRIQADAAGRVVCRWQAEDAHLDPETFQILYRPEQSTDWQQVPVQLQPNIPANIYSDQLAWWPSIPERELVVRIQISDQAGNQVFQDRRVVVNPVAVPRRNDSTASQPNPWSQSGWTKSNRSRVSPMRSPQVVSDPKQVGAVAKSDTPNVHSQDQSAGRQSCLPG